MVIMTRSCRPGLFFLLSSVGVCFLEPLRTLNSRDEVHSSVFSSIALSEKSWSLEARAISDPWDFTWIQNYTALGDSYAAGLGAGNASSRKEDAACSRYNGAYPVIFNSYLSNSQAFQFIACTGDTSDDVVTKQISTLADNSLDLVTISAGGNDVGFRSVLEACVYLTTTQQACTDAINNVGGQLKIAQLRHNVDNVITKLAPKMKAGHVVIWVLYAEFWNSVPNYCDNQTWAYWDPLGIAGLKLTSDNRAAMNKLVDYVNGNISSVIASSTGSTRPSRLNVVTADWDSFVHAVQGRFCEDIDSSTSSKTDDVVACIRKNDMSYSKRTIGSDNSPGVGRSAKFVTESLRPQGNTGSRKVTRASAPPKKENEGVVKDTALPDFIVKPFHPSLIGHGVITDAVISKLVLARAKILNVDPSVLTCPYEPPSGGHGPNPHCNGSTTNFWTSQPAAAEAVAEFCKNGRRLGSHPSEFQEYTDGSANDLTLQITYYSDLVLTKDQCTAAFMSIVDGCDGNDPDNPGNLKHGGLLEYAGGRENGAILEFRPNVGRTQKWCNNVSTTTYMDRDELAAEIPNFCAYATNPKVPNKDNPAAQYDMTNQNHVSLKINYPPSSNDEHRASDCESAMKVLNDGCYGQDPDHYNPSNYKHGGQIVVNGHILYTVQPMSNNTITSGSNYGSCDPKKQVLGNTGQGEKRIDKPTLQYCLGLNGGAWHAPGNEVDCSGMVTFYLWGQDWQSASDCHAACSNCLSSAINNGAVAANCDAWAGSAHCWEGFYVKP